jgi:GMP synthase (glutamine-hydrolysing)
VLIVDFGAQYTQLIARRVREAGVYSEIVPFDKAEAALKPVLPKAIILSGGPASVHETGTPQLSAAIANSGVPILGICYGEQAMVAALGGQVEGGHTREFGRAELEITGDTPLFHDVWRPGTRAPVWMSHGDRVTKLPDGFRAVAVSNGAPFAAIADDARKLYGVQFHPEVVHTPRGAELIDAFLFQVTGAAPDWTPGHFVEESVARIRAQVGDGAAVCGLSGGVDSSVAAMLVSKAIGDRLTCIFVDNGVLRKDEAKEVVRMFRDHFHLRLVHVDASKQFLDALAGVTDPEEKRKIIGRVFIEVFDAEAAKLEGVRFLVQGTLYPDVIESVSFKGGPSVVIKSHHNVGGLPEHMKLALIEPLRELFKDEVREVGAEMGMPHHVLFRHPFPGPGLAIRCLGEITAEKLRILRDADAIFIEELKAQGQYDHVWQAFAVILPVRTVGVMGDERTYDHVVAIRAVSSRDGMTADWARLPHDFLGKVSSRIINEVRGVNRVVYDISSKPPATIEWE